MNHELYSTDAYLREVEATGCSAAFASRWADAPLDSADHALERQV